MVTISPGTIASLTILGGTLCALSGCTTMVIRDLGTLGGDYAEAVAINDKGQVVGKSKTASGTLHVFLWDDGVMTDLGTLGGQTAEVFGYGPVLNNSSEVVGVSSTGSGESHAFLWKDGAMTDLGTLGSGYSRADAINKDGQVVGQSGVTNSVKHAVMWKDGTPIQDLEAAAPADADGHALVINDNGQVAGLRKNVGFFWNAGTITDLSSSGKGSHPFAINNSGQVVGDMDAASPVHAFFWDKGTLTDLGTLGGKESRGRDINKHGQVTGFSTTVTNDERAFIWEKGGTMIDLGPASNKALAINDCGTVVGHTKAGVTGGLHAFSWSKGTLTDLGTLPGGHESIAWTINRHGQIAGRSNTASGATHAVMWSKRCWLFNLFTP